MRGRALTIVPSVRERSPSEMRAAHLESSASLAFLIGLVGADRVMIGSDYCFDLGYERPVEVVTRLAGLSRADQARILGANASKRLGI